MVGNMGALQNDLKITMYIGSGNSQRFVDITELYKKNWGPICALCCRGSMPSQAAIIILHSTGNGKKASTIIAKI